MTLLGEQGLRQLAAINHAKASKAADVLAAVPGVELVTERFFNEFTLKLAKPAREVVRDLADKGILAGVALGRLYPDGDARENGLLVAVTETTTEEDVQTFASALKEALA
jgi:glycine dehydrogenase subunit 1